MCGNCVEHEWPVAQCVLTMLIAMLALAWLLPTAECKVVQSDQTCVADHVMLTNTLLSIWATSAHEERSSEQDCLCRGTTHVECIVHVGLCSHTVLRLCQKL